MEITSDDEPTEVVAWWAETPEVSHPRYDKIIKEMHEQVNQRVNE